MTYICMCKIKNFRGKYGMDKFKDIDEKHKDFLDALKMMDILIVQ